MIVTLSEARIYCQKALCAAGTAPGLDEEGGYAAAWLEARGLPGLATLADALARWTGDPQGSHLPQPATTERGLAIDATGRSAVILGRVLVDLAIVGSARAGAARPLTVENLVHPLFLLPHLADATDDGQNFTLTWQEDGVAEMIQATSGQGGTLDLYGSDWTGGKFAGAGSTTLCCFGTGSVPPSAATNKAVPDRTAADLAASYRTSLAQGLPVEDSLWECIAGMAAQTYVPATEESRRRGAGSSASDNE